MEDKLIEYFCYRFFLIETSNQLSIMHELRSKKELFKDIFDNTKKKKKIEASVRNKRCLIYYVRDFDETIFIVKFAKEKHFIKHEAGANDIVEEDIPDYPFIYILFDLVKQIILVENKTTVFQSPLLAKNMLEDFLTYFLHDHDYTIKIDEINDSDKFWEIVDRAEQIYSIKLNLKSPNIFGARFEANEFLKQQKELYNNTEMNVELKNEEGKLNLLRENIENFIDYIAAGGGRYILLVREKGLFRRIRSILNIKKHFLKELHEEDENKVKEILIEIDED